MATFHAIPAGEFTAPKWISYDWGGYSFSVDFDPAAGPASLYEAQNALYLPLANANAGGGIALAREQALALIQAAPTAWAAVGIREDNLGDVLAGVHDLFRDRLYNLDKNDLIDVIGQGAVYALIGAAVGNLAGLPSPGELFNAGPADLSGIPADLGYDFTPGPSLNAAPAASSSLMPAAIPESAAQLTEWGLVETSPGVWSQPIVAPSLPLPSPSSVAKPLIDAASKILAPLAPLVPAAIRAAFAGEADKPQAVAAQLEAPAPLLSAEAVQNLAFAAAALLGGYLLIKATK